MNMAKNGFTGAIVVVATAACSGCGSPPAPPPTYVPQPMPVAPMPAPVQPGPCDQPQFLATTTAMQARAAAEAPGMKPEGAPVCGVTPEGTAVVGPIFTLEQGYCYTFLGQSLPPVGAMEMELRLDLGGMMMPPALATMAQQPVLVSTTPGERVNMAEKQNCYQWPFPVPATVKLILKARAGSGPLAAQAYRKKKF
jgi:hypothetical protein